MRYYDNNGRKNGEKLNRVIIIDTDPASVKLQQENSIVLNKWTGDIYDNSLNDLAAFLLSNNLPCGQLLV